MKIKLRRWVPLLTLALLVSRTHWAGAHCKITDYTGNYVSAAVGFSNKGANEIVKWWLAYERKYQGYFNSIYWSDVSSNLSERKKSRVMRKRVENLKESVLQVRNLSGKSPFILEEILDFMQSYFGSRPSCHIFFSISPTETDAKAQWYRDHRDAIHINALSRSFKDNQGVKIILAHELFHLLQEQILEKSRQKIKYDSILGKLIAEGTASYFSSLYMKNTSLEQILFFEKEAYDFIVSRKRELARELIQVVEASDPKTLSTYFGYMKSPYPPRSGYYIAYSLVKRLAEKRDFKSLTTLGPNEWRSLIQEELKLIAEVR